MKKFLSTAGLVVIIITLVLFIVALFVKGLTQDLLLEAGVLLISVKIIMMNYSNKQINMKVLEKLEKMEKKED